MYSVMYADIIYIIITLLTETFLVYKFLCDKTQYIQVIDTIIGNSLTTTLEYRQDIVSTGKLNMVNVKNIEVAFDSFGIKLILYTAVDRLIIYNKFSNIELLVYRVAKGKNVTFVKDRNNELKTWFKIRFEDGQELLRKYK